MSRVKISMRQFSAYTSQLGSKFDAAIKLGLQSARARAVPVMVQATAEAPPANPQGVGTGGAFNNGYYSARWQSELIGENGVRVFNDAPYAGIIEDGRRPNSRFPPRGPIARWAQRRLGLSEEEARGVAYVIAAKIAERGLIGRKVLANATEKLRGIIITEILHELNRALSK